MMIHSPPSMGSALTLLVWGEMCVLDRARARPRGKSSENAGVQEQGTCCNGRTWPRSEEQGP